MHVWRTRPSKDKLANGDTDARNTDNGHHGLWWGFARGWVWFMCLNHAPDQRLTENGNHAPNSETRVGQPGDTGGPAADLGKDDRVGDKAEVEDGV